MVHYHAVVWLDHREARVFDFTADDVRTLKVTPAHPSRHLHHKSGVLGSGHAPEDQAYYRDVAEALSGAGEILVVGPGKAKLAFIKHVHAHARALEPKIVGVETVDHPTDAQLVAHARAYFKAADHMRPQR